MSVHDLFKAIQKVTRAAKLLASQARPTMIPGQVLRESFPHTAARYYNLLVIK